MVITSTKEIKIKEMTRYLYPYGLLFGTNIIIDKNIVFIIYAILPLLTLHILVPPPHIMNVTTQLDQILM